MMSITSSRGAGACQGAYVEVTAQLAVLSFHDVCLRAELYSSDSAPGVISHSAFSYPKGILDVNIFITEKGRI